MFVQSNGGNAVNINHAYFHKKNQQQQDMDDHLQDNSPEKIEQNFGLIVLGPNLFTREIALFSNAFSLSLS